MPPREKDFSAGENLWAYHRGVLETERQHGTPSVLPRGKGGMRWPARSPGSILAFLPTLAIFAVFLATPGSSRAQQWPRSSNPNPDFPHSDFPQGSQATDPDIGTQMPNDSLAAMESGAGMLPLMSVDNSRLIDAESCQTWTAAAVNSPTVSVTRLEVPGNASHEFQRACGDFKDNRLTSAEGHARNAVKIYPAYAAAWVVLGQILHAHHDDKDAIDACQTAKNADPTYAPPYICLAEFAASANDWDQVYALADHALTLDPATDAYAYLYTATADFHLKHLEQAELYALSAEKLDKWNHIPEIHLLLAEVYEIKRQPEEEAGELRKFIKDAPHNSDWETAKVRLAAIGSPAAK